MKRYLSLIIILILCGSGCTAYNSLNAMDVMGNNMTFKKGITGIKVSGVKRIVLQRNTNAGNGPAPAPIPYPGFNYCPTEDQKDNFADEE